METRAELLSLVDYWNVVRRRWRVLLVAFAVVVLTTAVVTFTRVPLYRATTTLIVEPDIPELAGFTGSTPRTLTREFYETQYAIIRSNAVLSRLCEECKLSQDQAFSSIPDPVQVLRRRVAVDPVPNSRLVRVSVDHERPETAMRLARTLASVYIERNLEDRRATSRNAFEWLSQQIEVRKGEVEESERALLEYRTQEDVVSLEKRQALLADQLATLSAQQREIKSRVLEHEVVLRELDRLGQSPENVELLPRVLENTQVANLRRELADLSSELSRVSQRYKPKHPEVMSLESRIGEVRERLAHEVGQIHASLEVEQRIDRAKLEAVDASVEAAKRESMQAAEQAIRWGVLEREAESNRQMFGVLLQRLREADVSGSLTGQNIRVLDPATLPDRAYKPNTSLNLSLGVLAGLAVGLALCFVVDQVDNTVKGEDDVEQLLGLPLAGVVTRQKARLKRVDDLPAPLVHAYGVVKTQLQLHSRDHVLRTLLVTSAVRGEGKSITAACLAAAFARSGVRTLLVDTDLFRGTAATFFAPADGGLLPARGLSDCFLHGAPLAEVIAASGIPNLDLVPCGLIPPNPAEPLGSPQLKALVDEAVARYQLVILDSPPVTGALEVAFLATAVDGILVVARALSTPRQLVRKVVGQLRAARGNVVGVLLTFAREGTGGASSYQYYYYSGDRDRSAE